MEPIGEKILAVVITYNPEIELLIKDIESFYQNVDKTLIWDNSEEIVSSIIRRKVINKFDNIIFLGDGFNKGISHGLNIGWKYAVEHNFDFLLTMDDDSVFVDFKTYKKRVLNRIKQTGVLALYGPLTNNVMPTEDSFSKKHHLITSGMLVPIHLLNKAGGYCNNFLVDGIDIELCIRLRKLGYDSFMDNKSRLIQKYGNPISRKILGFTLQSANYSPTRLYEIFRNHIIILREYDYPRDLLWHIIRLYLLGFVVKGILFVDHNKKQKLIAVYKGMKSGIHYKLDNYRK